MSGRSFGQRTSGGHRIHIPNNRSKQCANDMYLKKKK